MITHNLGYPRIGKYREIKKAVEAYWAGTISQADLIQAGKETRQKNRIIQQEAGIDLIPSNDFSFYDQVLDAAFAFGAIPGRYAGLLNNPAKSELDLYFAMARGFQEGTNDITAMEMTKWFDTNYHYIVPEFYRNQNFSLRSTKPLDEFLEAKESGIITKPVLLGPVSFLLLGKEKESGFNRLDLLENLLSVYSDLLTRLAEAGVKWIQIDEPFLALDLSPEQKEAYRIAYSFIRYTLPDVKILLATYFGGLYENSEFAVNLPVDAIHIDLVKAPDQLDLLLDAIPVDKSFSMGIIDGRNIWKNDFRNSLRIIHEAVDRLGEERLMIAPSCSLMHVPCDLDSETNETVLPAEIKNWLAFAKQKTEEVAVLKKLALSDAPEAEESFEQNQKAIRSRKLSGLIHNKQVRERLGNIGKYEAMKRNPFHLRKEEQQKYFDLPLFPTTTIGSFPQTGSVRSWRARLKKKELTEKEYKELIREEVKKAIQWQEEIGLDVLVHGEFERNDMVEYFGEMLEGFVFTRNGWVQSYGSRCVKPPVIFGDVQRPLPMTVDWIRYAQSLTSKPVKGMLTGPVTILEWSFVRDDQPRRETCYQIALAMRDEVLDLEKAGIKIIQIDEPALREGLPLRKKDWEQYLRWAVNAFRLTYAGVKDDTQIHTHMCYSEFNDIMDSIAALDADVITIECSRSQMELMDVFADFKYPNDIGPGIYDIHSPRVPTDDEYMHLLKKATDVIPVQNIWVNPDCGLKTRHWDETKEAIARMVKAAQKIRNQSARQALTESAPV